MNIAKTVRVHEKLKGIYYSIKEDKDEPTLKLIKDKLYKLLVELNKELY